MIDPRNPLLEISGLTKRFGGVEALVGVDFVVHRHEVVALVGDNAAGKSTLARTLAGVLAPDEGSIRLKGKEVSLLPHHRPEARHRLRLPGDVAVRQPRRRFQYLPRPGGLRSSAPR